MNQNEIYVKQKFEPVKFVDNYGKTYATTTNELKDQSFKYCLDPFDRLYDVGKEDIRYKTVYHQNNIETKEKDHVLVIWNSNVKNFLAVRPWDIEPKNKKKISSRKNINASEHLLIQGDKKNYINHIINVYKKRHSSKYSLKSNLLIRDQSDSLFMTRLDIKKDHPGILYYFDEQYPNNIDIVSKVDDILRFYLNNNENSTNNKEAAVFAYEYLKVCGFIHADGFQEAWELMINLYQLPK